MTFVWAIWPEDKNGWQNSSMLVVSLAVVSTRRSSGSKATSHCSYLCAFCLSIINAA